MDVGNSELANEVIQPFKLRSMVDRIEIKNFKSIVDLNMNLGRVNIIIGSNGCGKTNILESLAIASAASKGKSDNEFLLNRGIRIPNAQFLKPSFADIDPPKAIEITVYEGKSPVIDARFKFNKSNKEWEDLIESDSYKRIQDMVIKSLKASGVESKVRGEFRKQLGLTDRDKVLRIVDQLSQKLVAEVVTKNNKELLNKEVLPKRSFLSFLIYSPNEHVLRGQNSQSPISPIGVHGEGLFSFLKEQLTGDKELFAKLNEGLSLLDWFDGMEVPKDLLSNETRLKIGDRYLKNSLHHFDQRSANEGFLYLLFYLTLFNSKETPAFFAIDNIDTSLNPKLCTHLIQYLIEAAKTNNKQVILTTHSPYVLDGLDLSDDEQRLFVARRNIDGHTRVERIPYKKERNMRLSDLWMSGLIGGLPDNF